MNRGYFRIPGHRFERGIPGDLIDFAGKNIFRLDLTETPLTDDLHNPESVIAESQRYTAEAFGAARSFYLVNGTTCGNESMIIASASEGEKILIPRNAHKSVMAGLVISGAQPVYMPVEYMPETGLTGVLKPETAKTLLAATPDAKAIFGVSPSYHGFCSDIRTLADTAHTAGIPLLVDEAHGAHLYFSSRLPDGAIKLGADACAQSMHKTGGSLTQSSLLHLRQEAGNGKYLDPAAVENALRITMSTSPSYLLMCSLETARHDLEENGEKYWSGTIELANDLRKGIEEIPGFSCPSESQFRESGIFDLDPTRLIINCDYAAIGGYALKSLLWDKYRIDVEMADSRNILVILTYGNTVSDTVNLVKALSDISAQYGTDSRSGHTGRITMTREGFQLFPRWY